MTAPVLHVAHAQAVTESLHEEEAPLGLALEEAVCPACLLAYWLAAGARGVCRDCHDEIPLIPVPA